MILDKNDPALTKWLSTYDAASRSSRTIMFNGFYKSLQSHDRLKDLLPSQLCDFQSNAEKKDQYVILDGLQDYIRTKGGTFGGLKTVYSSCLAFFMKNRCALPPDKFVIKPSREPTKDNLGLQMVKDLVSVADLGMKAFYLTLFSGLLDQERFQVFNQSHASDLVKHLKEKGVDEPYKIEFSGRKGSKNKALYYTFIGRDALGAWSQYFERVRGFPEAGEPILLDSNNNPFTKANLRAHHHRLLKKLRYINPEKNRLVRYGTGLHNFRDCAVTTLHYHKDEGIDKDTVEFFLGHVTDPNNYDKFYKDSQYVTEQYRIAEKYLNLISGTAGSDQEKTKELETHTAELEAKVKLFQNTAVEALKRLDSLDAIVERIKKLEKEKPS